RLPMRLRPRAERGLQPVYRQMSWPTWLNPSARTAPGDGLGPRMKKPWGGACQGSSEHKGRPPPPVQRETLYGAIIRFICGSGHGRTHNIRRRRIQDIRAAAARTLEKKHKIYSIKQAAGEFP